MTESTERKEGYWVSDEALSSRNYRKKDWARSPFKKKRRAYLQEEDSSLVRKGERVA